jgi:hypothetical protein
MEAHEIFGPESKEASNFGYYLMRNFCFDYGLWVVRKCMIYADYSAIVKLRKLQRIGHVGVGEAGHTYGILVSKSPEKQKMENHYSGGDGG